MNGMLTVLHENQYSGVRFPKLSMSNVSAGSLFPSSALPCVGCDTRAQLHINRIVLSQLVPKF